MKKIWIIAVFKQNKFEWLNQLQFSYVNAVQGAWAIAYIIPCNTNNFDHFVAEMDGFIFPGADEDICPSLYWQESHGSRDCVLQNDTFLLEAIEQVINAGKPILGICKGHQMINTYFGGTLVQDMDDNGVHLDVSKYSEVVHDIEIQQESFLFEAFWISTLWVNSAHHQCIDTLWDDLRVIAKSTDWYIEAIEHTTQKIYGVQWHPERVPGHTPIFKKFIDKI